MALIPCPECGKIVSENATNCPKCGYPIAHNIHEPQPTIIEQEVDPQPTVIEQVVEPQPAVVKQEGEQVVDPQPAPVIQENEPKQPILFEKPNNYWVWSILCTLFCCLPLGIVALIHSMHVDSNWAKGEYQKAIDHADNARDWLIIAAVMGILLIIFMVISYYATTPNG